MRAALIKLNTQSVDCPFHYFFFQIKWIFEVQKSLVSCTAVFLALPMPSVLLSTAAKDRGRERLYLPGNYSPARRSNFRFPRPGTLAVSFHVADNDNLAPSKHCLRNAAGKSDPGKFTFVTVIWVAAPLTPFG